MGVDSDVRSQIVKYLVGADAPENEYSLDFEKVSYEHFVIPFGYPKVFNDRVKYSILHLNDKTELEDVNRKLLKDVLKYRQLIEDNEWGLFKNKIGPQRYKKVVNGIASLNMSLVDAKVSIDLKRILKTSIIITFDGEYEMYRGKKYRNIRSIQRSSSQIRLLNEANKKFGKVIDTIVLSKIDVQNGQFLSANRMNRCIYIK